VDCIQGPENRVSKFSRTKSILKESPSDYQDARTFSRSAKVVMWATVPLYKNVRSIDLGGVLPWAAPPQVKFLA
jgi:hypothetical protein